MIWRVTAGYQGDSVEFDLVTESDDLKNALPEAQKEANRIFRMTGVEGKKDSPTVFVRKHPNVL